MKTKTLMIVGAAALAFVYLRPKTVRTTAIPGATPVVGSYFQSPAYAARGIQQTAAQGDMWGTLGGALGSFLKGATAASSAAQVNNAVTAPDISVTYSPDTAPSVSNDSAVYQSAPGTYSQYFDPGMQLG